MRPAAWSVEPASGLARCRADDPPSFTMVRTAALVPPVNAAARTLAPVVMALRAVGVGVLLGEGWDAGGAGAGSRGVDFGALPRPAPESRFATYRSVTRRTRSRIGRDCRFPGDACRSRYIVFDFSQVEIYLESDARAGADRSRS